MGGLYWGSFVVASGVWGGLQWSGRKEGVTGSSIADEAEETGTGTGTGTGMATGIGMGKDKGNGMAEVEVPAGFAAFQRNYLVVYLLAMFVDWLKGPYVYVLYESYGFSKGDIALLFIGGFGASMVAGTVAGALADSLGRKKMALVFAACYAVAGLTKVSASFSVLMIGRILSGVATSLLFSVFEAWMVCEHNARGYPPALLSQTFSRATTGNGLVAVAAGLVAMAAASTFGYVAPFVLALVPLAVLAGIVSRTWNENYGDATIEVSESLRRAVGVLAAAPHLVCLGLAQALFEGGMYTFVFMWSPALATEETRDVLPYGVIFAVYMVCIMIGSALFNVVDASTLPLPLLLHGAAIGSMLSVPAFFDAKPLVYLAFCGFEVACGMFFPTYGTLRSAHIPEATRSTMMNLFRIPLNAFVLIVLIKVKHMPVTTVFWICALAHLGALACYIVFASRATVYARARHAEKHGP
ncbi:major facilitator superfamily transporter [Thecamonas trahens ATCC 50062]|uniref:Molybdate-anion transporter n=1 Tax=Thecamonas trahens ATCC 50062 TaxID=461836 RepID=A0A0L0DPV0_THETB|nr:major facilitator superfamily transporter [Thecamonas trahens ATCC 50062]KNC54290.1 major facilitator superfamily transporter [Thecamonas trahens ATCC 50062]|eukprot:XP_013753755.1 major facilitator superfamily transporter [Thecamonas trahens ATCC 50062]